MVELANVHAAAQLLTVDRLPRRTRNARHGEDPLVAVASGILDLECAA